jgi:hypothetical protein
MQAAETIPTPTGIVEIGGRQYLPDAKGNLVLVDQIKPQTRLEDDTVRKIIGYAETIEAQLSRFFGHTMSDLDALDALLAEKYGARKGGKKGNRTYQSFDGLYKVQVQVADRIDFGPELQAAKALIDECIVDWVEGGRDEIRAIVMRAFNVEKEGKINQAELFMLLRLEIADSRWQRAMQAIRDAIRVTGTKQYVRFYKRASAEADWVAVTIDLAKV